ncbi:ABC transporter permease [Brevibacterium sp. BRM-1]|uniref:ABC transporter permease n=1 Tax=Brevibacterium sp. BRM-1 TaxID=2999062 RepID=UPI002280D660|nr:ABC transporter permease [Brevibacterium sp. BRM-1]WAL39425.1 ABC transporter permease [Brevibacterium sp. BRM-1]
MRPRRIRPLTLAAAAVIALVIAWALAPGLFTRQDPNDGGTTAALLAPSGAHWFGTDEIGRDVFARMVYGASHSLLAALIAVGVGLVVGTALGLIAGSRRGWAEDVIMRAVDVLLSIPALLLSLTIVIILGFGTVNAAIAVGVTAIAQFARLTRSQVVRVGGAPYVQAAYGSGAGYGSVLVRHIVPNSLSPVLALAVLQIGWAILQISTLGFLGYGTPPPTPEWGLIIAEGRNYVATSWWLTVFPGLIIMIVVLATHRLGTALRQVSA